ncbi:signal peptide containing protein, putative [Perkinsus marinus ATCC 50983]|uniref:Signal peptide containing protein, putative n=1 Tax=Perkinsus marinus (strain ATCC 50983 / TXsc) TaxID=423536 RepID=C5KSM1_PERM5|nr:signal peptide containing protein, putative [Perkinsus marinus ATCC 50983]EER12515.1 signal peptide containing protein, putative [Perkinsus marinus ATCC 50983]|eukprot:XP_002780720.1 signal peptide containing protein, putative [Perkinsus marinus ATCC 50983]
MRYLDGVERAERLAMTQAQKRVDELLEGPGSATGNMLRIHGSTTTQRGRMKPPSISVTTTTSSPPRSNRFERLYAEGAERAARRKDLEKAVIEEEDAKLREEIATARLGWRNRSVVESVESGSSQGGGGGGGLKKSPWERMSKQEADNRAMKLQKMKDELAEKERQEIEASRVNIASHALEDAVDSRRAKLEQLASQFSAEEKAKIDAARFKKPGKPAKSVDIREMTNRLYAEGEKRRAKLEQMQEEAELREIAKVTKVDRKDGKVAGSIPGAGITTKRKSSGHQRLYAESQARKERIAKLAQAVKAEEEKECTYQPNLQKSRPRPINGHTLGTLRSPTGNGGIHENLYRDRAARDERIRKMREEKEALEVCSVGSRTTPKTPTRKDLHASLHDEVYKRKAEAEAAEKEKEELVKSFLHASRKTPVRAGLHDRLFEESKLRHDALMKRLQEKEDREAATTALRFKEEVKIPKRKKVQEPTPPPVETVLDQTPVDKDASVDSLAKVDLHAHSDELYRYFPGSPGLPQFLSMTNLALGVAMAFSGPIGKSLPPLVVEVPSELPIVNSFELTGDKIGRYLAPFGVSFFLMIALWIAVPARQRLLMYRQRLGETNWGV